MSSTISLFGDDRHYPIATMSFIVMVWLGQGKLTDFMFQPLIYFINTLGFTGLYSIDAFGLSLTELWIGAIFYGAIIFFRGITFAWQTWVAITVLWLAISYFV